MDSSQVWHAQHYDQKLNFVSKYGSDLLSLLQAKPHEHILDLGCGSGHLTAQIANTTPNVTGLDYSANMIEQAKSNYKQLNFIVANGENFLLEHQVDAVFSNAALHWMKNKANVIRSVKKALKPGGRFVAEFGGKNNVRFVINAIEDVLQNLYNIDAKVLNPWYFPSITEYATALEQEGFYVQYAEHYNRLTPMEDGEIGLYHWLDGFASPFFAELNKEKKEQAYKAIAKKLEGELYINGTWYIDYKRLRVVAYKN